MNTGSTILGGTIAHPLPVRSRLNLSSLYEEASAGASSPPWVGVKFSLSVWMRYLPGAKVSRAPHNARPGSGPRQKEHRAGASERAFFFACSVFDLFLGVTLQDLAVLVFEALDVLLPERVVHVARIFIETCPLIT
jgi:hypothetical protein